MSDTKIYKRKTYICERCGKRTTNYEPRSQFYATYSRKAGDSYCDDCIRYKKQVRAWQNEQRDTLKIVCPHCGYAEPDSDDLPYEDAAYQCENCGEVFSYESWTPTLYTSWKLEDEYPESWR